MVKLEERNRGLLGDEYAQGHPGVELVGVEAAGRAGKENNQRADRGTYLLVDMTTAS